MSVEEQEKRMLAAQLVHLTLREPTISGRGITAEYRDQIRNRYFDEQTELRVKHFSLNELRALLDFYQ